MITRLVFVYCLVFWHFLGTAQNLVPNPSFEEFNACPSTLGEIYKATGWNSVKLSPDYFNSCAPNSSFNSASVPHNFWGYQTPASGNGYAGFAAMYGNGNIREYLGASLLVPLEIGVKYFVSFKVCLAYRENSLACAVNKLGILFSTYPYSENRPAPICNCSQIFTNSIIQDSVNWTVVNACFIADSSYSFISIGNFFTDSFTDTLKMQGELCNAYYYLDDVCISTDSQYCFNYSFTGLNSFYTSNYVKFYPNPVKDFLIVEGAQNFNQEIFTIYNAIGQGVSNGILTNLKYNKLNLSSLPKGSYTIAVYGNGFSKSNYKFIKF